MSEMRASGQENQTKWGKDKKKKLDDAKKLLREISRTTPEFRTEILLDRESIAHDFLHLEIANLGPIGPGLNLAPTLNNARKDHHPSAARRDPRFLQHSLIER
jgi:hypothetical protein